MTSIPRHASRVDPHDDSIGRHTPLWRIDWFRRFVPVATPGFPERLGRSGRDDVTPSSRGDARDVPPT